MDKKKWIIALSILLLLIIIFVFFKFGMNKKHTIIFDTDGGNEISSIEIKDGNIIKLPSNLTKDGYKFGGWVNKNNNIITEKTKITNDMTLKAIWISNDAETVTLIFDTDGSDEIENIVIEKGKDVLLPIAPAKDKFIFAGWINEDGNIVTDGMTIADNIKLKALWIRKDAEIETITFDTDGGSNIGKIIVEKGSNVRFPINPIKNGYVFKGWIDSNNITLTEDTIISQNMTIKAVWVEPYTCPNECMPSKDGSACVKVSTKQLVSTSGCPNGYTLKENQCLNLSTRYDRDAPSSYGGNPRNDGMCLSSEGSYTEEYGGGAKRYCAKKKIK